MKSSRGRTAILYLTAERVTRVDLDLPDRAVEHGRAPGAGLAAVEAALADSPPEAAYIADERAWTQTLALPNGAVAGLQPAQLERALAFELEPLSGIPADDSALAAHVLSDADGQRRLWVTQVRRSELDALATALRARGVRLLGVVHPAGLDGAGAPRVEVWEQATCCVPENGKAPDLLVIGARAGQRSWARGVRDWLCERNGSAVAWIGRARPALAEVPERAGVIADRGDWPRPPALSQWLAGAARALAANPSPVPLIAPPRAARRRLEPRAAGIALAALVTAFAYFDHRALQRALGALELESSVAGAAAADVQRLRQRNAELEQQYEKLAPAAAARSEIADSIEREWKAQRARLPGLLAAVAELRPDALVVRWIRTTAAGAFSVEGAGAEAGAIDSFTAALSLRLRPLHFHVQPAASSVESTESGARFFRFAIVCSPEAVERSSAEAGPP